MDLYLIKQKFMFGYFSYYFKIDGVVDIQNGKLVKSIYRFYFNKISFKLFIRNFIGLYEK